MALSAHVVIVDDDAVLIRAVASLLTSAGHRTTVHETPDHLFEQLAQDPADLLILDLALPGSDGLTVLERVRQHPAHRDLPILVLSASPASEVAARALALGAGDFVSKPFHPPELVARVDAQLRARQALTEARAAARTGDAIAGILRELSTLLSPAEVYQRLVGRIAQERRIERCSIVADDRNGETATVLAANENPALRHLTVELRRYPEIREALATGDPLLIADVYAHPSLTEARDQWRAEGHRVTTTSAAAIPFRIRDDRTAVCFLRSSADGRALDHEDLDFARRAIDAMAPVLDRAYDFEAALRRQDEMRELAETDPLTGLFNRRALQQRLQSILDRAAPLKSTVSCLMLDLDHFKRLNDAYGHGLGDRVLVQLAELLRREQRTMDVVARWGGEEFVVVLPDTGLRGARLCAERLLRRVASTTFGDGGTPVQMTVSIGIATYPDERVTDLDSLVQVADSNLLRAKAEGRHRYRD